MAFGRNWNLEECNIIYRSRMEILSKNISFLECSNQTNLYGASSNVLYSQLYGNRLSNNIRDQPCQIPHQSTFDLASHLLSYTQYLLFA